MMKKLCILFAFVLLLAGCSTADVPKNSIDGVLTRPSDYVEVADIDLLQYTNDNLSVGIYHFDNSDQDPLALFDAEFRDFTYIGFTNELCFTMTVNDDDYLHSEYRFELHSVDLAYKRSSGTINGEAANANYDVCIDAVNDDGLWEVIFYKTTDSTDEFVQKAHGFFFQIHKFDDRKDVTIFMEQNVYRSNSEMQDSIEYNIRIHTDAQIKHLNVVVRNIENGDVIVTSVIDVDGYINDDGMFEYTGTVYLLSPDSEYRFSVYATGSDGVIEYNNYLIKEMIFFTE